MSEEIANLLFEHLKALRNEVRDIRDEYHSETGNLKHRMSARRDAYFGAIRIAPSRRITSPLSMSLVMIWCTSLA